MDEWEDLHMDRTNICFSTIEAEGEGSPSRKSSLSPPPSPTPFPPNVITDRSEAVVSLWYFFESGSDS